MNKNMAVLDQNKNVINIIVCAIDQQETETLVAYDDANPAYIGGDLIDGFFYPPKPYESWSRESGQWVAPVDYPTDGLSYSWNEAELAWELMDFSGTPAE